MRFLRLLWQIPYSLYCWLLFALAIIGASVCLLGTLLVCHRETAIKQFYQYVRPILHGFGFLTGIRFRYPTQFDFPLDTPYIFIGNHTTLLDMAFLAFTPLDLRILAKAEIQKIPVLSWIGSKIAIYVQRFDEKSRSQSIEALRVLATTGCSLALFPEGTRYNGTQPLTVFHKGAFLLSLEYRLPLLPAIITGGRKVMGGKQAFFWHPGTMEMTFLPPIQPPPADFPVETYMAQVRTIMEAEVLNREPFFAVNTQ